MIFLSRLKSALETHSGGTKPLLELDCSKFPCVQSYFSERLPLSGSLRDGDNFPCFSPLLGPSYYFYSYDRVSESGWGYLKRKKENACYVQYILVEKKRKGKGKGTLKFGVHLAVKNDYGRWQVIRGGS